MTTTWTQGRLLELIRGFQPACVVAAAADGIIVETHPVPDEAMSDGQQSLDFPGFERMMEGLRPIATAVGRSMKAATPKPPAGGPLAVLQKAVPFA